MSRILKLVETCLNYRNGTRLSTSSEYPRLLAIMLHRLFVEHSQLTFSNTTLSSSALNLLLSLCNWFPASDMIEITKRLPDIFYRINANRNVHNIDLIHKFYENVLEKSYERPKIFTILIVPAIQFYDMMHSINCEKNVNIAFLIRMCSGLFGLIFFGIILPEILTKKSVRYRVMPIGINTTIPAIKLLRNLAKKDFLTRFAIHQE